MNYPLKFELDRRQAVLNIGYGAGSSPTFGTVLVADGTAAAPSISFSADTDTGFYRNASNSVALSNGGFISLRFINSGGGIIQNGNNAASLSLLDTGAVGLTAAGTNQNITFTPSGSGAGAGKVVVTQAISSTGEIAGIQCVNTDLGSGNIAGVQYKTGVSANVWQTFARNGDLFIGVATVADYVQFKQTTGRLLLGTGATDSGALLQVGTDLITKENGIVLGTDTFIYRRLSGAVAVAHATQPQIYLSDLSGTVHAYVLGSTNLLRLGGNAATAQTRIDSGGAQACLFDTSQNAAFAGNITAPLNRSIGFQSSGVFWNSGTGSPEGVLSAPVGSIYSRTNGGAGTTLYVKESGAANTGWIAK